MIVHKLIDLRFVFPVVSLIIQINNFISFPQREYLSKLTVPWRFTLDRFYCNTSWRLYNEADLHSWKLKLYLMCRCWPYYLLPVIHCKQFCFILRNVIKKMQCTCDQILIKFYSFLLNSYLYNVSFSRRLLQFLHLIFVFSNRVVFFVTRFFFVPSYFVLYHRIWKNPKLKHSQTDS